MSFRITTNGTLRTYRANLMNSRKTLNDSITKVQTHRVFNTYAEDPASASKAFQLRRSMYRADSQITNNQTVLDSYETAYLAMKNICDGDHVEDGINGLVDSIAALDDSKGGARKTLGQSLLSKAESVVKAMNAQYSDGFVFSGSDGLNVPFVMKENSDGTRSVFYRGFDVDSEDGTMSRQQLDKMSEEATYVDIGLGFKEISDGKGGVEIVDASAYNSALCGINFLGYGVDEDGDPKNIISIMNQLGKLFHDCDPETGAFPKPADENRELANRLTNKLVNAVGEVGERRVELTANADYLKNNLNQLETSKKVMDEQREGIEAIDPADAIMQLSFAQYCWNASLKIGNSILSQSLLDYMN